MASYTLVIQATDGKQASTATVHLYVVDVNDNSPVFSAQYYVLEASEAAPPGTTVGQVSATDADEGFNAQVRYTLLSRFGADKFNLHPTTGVLTLTAQLDYEQVTCLLVWNTVICCISSLKLLLEKQFFKYNCVK